MLLSSILANYGIMIKEKKFPNESDLPMLAATPRDVLVEVQVRRACVCTRARTYLFNVHGGDIDRCRSTSNLVPIHFTIETQSSSAPFFFFLYFKFLTLAENYQEMDSINICTDTCMFFVIAMYPVLFHTKPLLNWFVRQLMHVAAGTRRE